MASPQTADIDAAFHKKLRVAAQQIMTAAAGRRCGDCIHADLSQDGEGDCLLQVNIDDVPLKINSFAAYACTRHESSV